MTLVVEPTSSFELLSIRIGEAMKKFSIFEGLDNLRAFDLAKNRQLLPKKGQISKHCRTGDVITFDLTANDLWIAVVIGAGPTVVGFQTKVPKHYSVKLLSEVTLTHFVSLSPDTALKPCRLDMRRPVEPIENTTLPNQLLGFELMERVHDLEVKDLFSFINKELVCRIELNDTSSQQGLNHSLKLPIRKVSIITGLPESKAPDELAEGPINASGRCVKCWLL
jgi:hypothetical protein